MGFFSSLLGLQEVLTLTIAGDPGEYWVNLHHVVPVAPSDSPRTLIATVGLTYGQLHFSVYGTPWVQPGIFDECDRLAQVLSSEEPTPGQVLQSGEMLLDQCPETPSARWSARILSRRRDGALFARSSMLRSGEEVLAIDYVRFLVARVLPVLSAQQKMDLAAVLRGMNAYYRRTGDITAAQSPSRAFYDALRSADADPRQLSVQEAEERGPSRIEWKPGHHEGETERRTCPRCGLGWVLKYFTPGSPICMGCQHREAETRATAGVESQGGAATTLAPPELRPSESSIHRTKCSRQRHASIAGSRFRPVPSRTVGPFRCWP